MAEPAQQPSASEKPATPAEDEGHEPEGQGAEPGTPESTELQRRAQLNRQFTALTKRQKEFEHRSKVEREKFEGERKAFEAERQKHAQEMDKWSKARRSPGDWMRAGGFNYDQLTEEQLRGAGAPPEDPRIKAMEERFEAMEKANAEREKQLTAYQQQIETNKQITHIAKAREAAKEQFELCNHFADTENVDAEVHSYIMKHYEQYGEYPTVHEALERIEEVLMEATEMRVKKFLASPKIASRVGWKDPKSESQPGDDSAQAEEPHVQQTKQPARGKPKQPVRAAGQQKPRFKDLPLDPEKRLEAIKLQLAQRRA